MQQLQQLLTPALQAAAAFSFAAVERLSQQAAADCLQTLLLQELVLASAT
jgi:hypothetical protein